MIAMVNGFGLLAPVRLVVTIGEALRAGRPIHRLLMPIAAWMRFIVRQAKAGVPIVDPDAEVLADNRYVHIVTRDGVNITGRILNEDTFSLQLIDSKEQLVSLQKADLTKFEFQKNSAMPSYRDKLSGAELSDLVGYLLSLKGL